MLCSFFNCDGMFLLARYILNAAYNHSEQYPGSKATFPSYMNGIHTKSDKVSVDIKMRGIYLTYF